MSASQYVTAMSSPLVVSSITKLVLIPMFMNLCTFTQQSEVKQSGQTIRGQTIRGQTIRGQKLNIVSMTKNTSIILYINYSPKKKQPTYNSS